MASIANVATYLVKIGWDGFGISATIWTILLVLIAVVINVIVTWKRNMREFALVGAWALIGIGNANSLNNELLMYIAFCSAALLIISSSIHGFKNRDTSPLIKFQKWKKS